jgi:hypothetical protein
MSEEMEWQPVRIAPCGEEERAAHAEPTDRFGL